jgi:hypothetical protein
VNDDTILALGGFCTELLREEAFQALVQLYSQQCAADVLNTKPHEVKAREQIYASYLGFENFLALTKKFSEAYEKLTNDPVIDELDEIDDPSVHDIYNGMN